MQTCRFISSVNSTFMGSFLLSPDDDIEEEALCLFEAADLILRQRTRPHAGELVQLLGGFAYRNSGQQVLVAIVKHRLSLPARFADSTAFFFENFRIRKRLSAKDSLSMPMLCYSLGGRKPSLANFRTNALRTYSDFASPFSITAASSATSNGCPLLSRKLTLSYAAASYFFCASYAILIPPDDSTIGEGMKSRQNFLCSH